MMGGNASAGGSSGLGQENPPTSYSYAAPQQGVKYYQPSQQITLLEQAQAQAQTQALLLARAEAQVQYLQAQQQVVAQKHLLQQQQLQLQHFQQQQAEMRMPPQAGRLAYMEPPRSSESLLHSTSLPTLDGGGGGAAAAGDGPNLPSSLFPKDILTKPKKKVFECPTCQKTFTLSGNLRRHMQIHAEPGLQKKHVCELCNKSYSRRGDLITHYRSHTGQKPHKCKECGRSFSRKSDLRAHSKTHSDSRELFMCTYPGCGKTFTRSFDVKKHVGRVHSNGKTSSEPNQVALKYQPQKLPQQMHHKVRKSRSAKAAGPDFESGAETFSGLSGGPLLVGVGPNDQRGLLWSLISDPAAAGASREVSLGVMQDSGADKSPHRHGAGCGHSAWLHDDHTGAHIDFYHPSTGHMECFQGKTNWLSGIGTDKPGGDQQCCSLPPLKDVNGVTGQSSQPRSAQGSAPKCNGEQHGPDCGHPAVHHNGHIDYVIDSRLVHPLGNDWGAVEDHGGVVPLEDDFLGALETLASANSGN
jgi:uncharacterized C2H2 Zn-finger protein